MTESAPKKTAPRKPSASRRDRASSGALETEGERRDAPAELLRLIQEGWQAKQDAEAYEAVLKEINARICQVLQPGQAVEVPGLCRAMHAERRTVTVENVEALYKELGRRFPDLVNEQVSYRPTEKLLAMAEKDPEIKGALKITLSRSVRYQPLPEV